MSRISFINYRNVLLVILALLLNASAVFAQSSNFTYQGRLTDGGTPANGTYDLQFKLFDMLTGGTQEPQPTPITVERTGVQVTSGIFTVQLDFGVSAFPGFDRFLEIGVRHNSGESYTTLTPRQQITSTAYALRSLNATTADTSMNSTQLGGVAANQYVQTNDSRLSDARPPTPGSSNYVQNTTSQQSSGNFNISGDGTAGGTLSGNVLNAAAQYNINGSRVLSVAGTSNLFAGVGAGSSNATGGGNSFVGASAGSGNIAADNNSFFGSAAGYNSTGGANSFFGAGAGQSNLGGAQNSFFGKSAGFGNTTGTGNTGVGLAAGISNTTGNNNTFIGANANAGNNNLSNAAAIGANALVTQSSSLVLGSGVNVGIGTSAPGQKLEVVGNVKVSGTGNGFMFSDGTSMTTAGATLGGNNFFGNQYVAGKISVGLLGLGGSSTLQLCLNNYYEISNCSSSLRYKSHVAPFSEGLDLLGRLRPVSFTWRDSGQRDLGLVAEEVNKVEPLLVTRNAAGEVEGVKYDRLSVVLINAVKEQQQTVTSQQQTINQLKDENAALRARLEKLERAVEKLQPK